MNADGKFIKKSVKKLERKYTSNSLSHLITAVVCLPFVIQSGVITAYFYTIIVFDKRHKVFYKVVDKISEFYLNLNQIFFHVSVVDAIFLFTGFATI